MLSTIKASLTEAINVSDDMSDGLNKSEICWRKIEEHLKAHTFIMNSDEKTEASAPVFYVLSFRSI